MNKTSIGWTTFTANPLKYRRKSDGAVVWGCQKVSPGCVNCYAEALALRYGRGREFTAANLRDLEPFLDEAELRKMLTAQTIGGMAVSGSRCFVGDMTDCFGEWVPDELLVELFGVLALRQDVTWQLLTKRADRLRRVLRAPNAQEVIDHAAFHLSHDRMMGGLYDAVPDRWPLPNVWLGVSVEDQQRADERIPLLLQTPAAVRFLSVEPLLGVVDLRHVHYDNLIEIDALTGDHGVYRPLQGRSDSKISWVVCGGESGPGARPCDPAWIADLARQCQAAGVSVFVKQGSGPRPGMQGDIPDEVWALKEFPS